MLLVVMFFGMATVFAQVYSLNITWSDENCDCLGTTANNYFKISYEIIDVANDDYEVIPVTTEYTPDATYSEWDISVSAVSTYCGSIHNNTPSLKVFVWVWLMESDPVGECCTGRGEFGPYSCQYFYDNEIPCPVGDLE